MTTRRQLLKGSAALPLATVLASPDLVRAASAATEKIEIETPSGKQVSGALATPGGKVHGAVLLIHEWWGLNDQIRAVASDLAANGYLSLAADLYGGKSTTSRDEARSLMKAVDPAVATETLVAWIDWLKRHEKSTGKVATIGWCFGGGWSLNASIATPVDATIVYYGNVWKTEQELASLQSPVLGHFATEDGWIDENMVSGFEKAMDAAGKTYTSHWYEAQHGFANPTTGRYDEADASAAWKRTLDFLAAHIGGHASLGSKKVA